MALTNVEKRKRYYIAHPERVKAQVRAWRKKNPKLVQQYWVRWANKNLGFTSWASMIQRCYNKNHTRYKDYGGRGIEVCSEWRHSFLGFKEHMGLKPKGYQIDRINVDGNYEPGNCRWVTPKQNSNNRRNQRGNQVIDSGK